MPGAVIDVEARSAIGAESTGGTGITECNVEVVVAIHVGKLRTSRRESDVGQSLDGLILEDPGPIVDEQAWSFVVILSQDHVRVTVAIAITKFNPPKPAGDSSGTNRRFIGEVSRAVIDVESDLKSGTLAGVSLTVCNRKVEVTIEIEVTDRKLVRIEGLRRQPKSLFDELLGMQGRIGQSRKYQTQNQA